MTITDKSLGAVKRRDPLFHPKILTTLSGYDRHTALSDIIAGISVSLVAFPLAIAIAIASGARPEAGLITVVIAGVLISLLGGSRVQIGGPTGAFIVVVAGVVAEHGYDGLLTATLMAGIILVIAGFTRMGNLIKFIPEAVINGFTIGIAVIIGASQLADALGIELPHQPSEFIPKIAALWEARDGASLGVAFLTIGTLVMLAVLRRFWPRFPGLIVAVIVGSGIALAMGPDVATISSRFGELSASIPAPALPDLSWGRLSELLPSAITIAFLAGVESLLSAMVADRMSGNNHRSNTEIIAQGVANIASPLFGGLPATGAIARTATNIRAGGKTPVSGIVHALVVLVFVVALTPVVGYLAMPALAAVLLMTAWNMSEPHKLAEHFRRPMEDRVLLLVTLLLTVVADLTVAIGVGVVLGLIVRLRRRNVPPADWSMPDR